MVAIGRKKYQSGEATQFMSRKAALKKLQLNLKDFRRLCIIKGIYPREPRNLKRAGKGHYTRRTMYHKKDIQFLLHEPIINKFRELKVFNRKVARARSMRNKAEMNRFLNNHPQIKIDHIVKERYPTFVDALRDLDDCLSLCFLFSTFPSMAHIPRDQSILCRRLTIEFMNAVIAAKALRKVFISIKGYYYQAEIKGQKITWIVPHHFSFEPQSKADVDFRVMSIFVEFYIVMLGFVNYRLYNTMNLYYPPKFSSVESSEKELVDEEAFVSERIAALNVPLIKVNGSTEDAEELEIDDFAGETSTEMEAAKEEAAKVKKLKTLFKGLKIFINREVPREPLVFVLRCFGAEVSWDKLLFVGSTFDEDDESITHHIVDRPSMDKQYLSRYYIQPQWVFDSVNRRELLPVEKYLMGCSLPPHLSPFSDNRRDQTYIPPEERILLDPEYKMKSAEDNEEEDDEENEDEEENESMEEEEDEQDENDEQDSEESEEEDEDESIINKAEKEYEKDLERQRNVKPSKVLKSEVVTEVAWEKDRQDKQAYRLREKMVPRKHRNLYKGMMKGRQERAKDIWLLRKKRRVHEEAEKEKKKEQRKVEKPKKKQAV